MFNKLKARIFEKYGTQNAFAEDLGWSKQWMSAKMTGKSEFSKPDIILWVSKLDIPKDEVFDYFFSDIGCENSTEEENDSCETEMLKGGK